jgi:hypothetical protein
MKPTVICNFSAHPFIQVSLSSASTRSGQSEPETFLPNRTVLQIQSKMSANVNNLAVVHHAFNILLTSLTSAQMSNFTQQLRAAPITTTSLTTPRSTPELNQYGRLAPADDSPTRRDKRAARAKVKEARLERSKLRPLNAFMAFRCKSLPSREKTNSANLTISILFVAASRLTAEDKVRPHP